MAIILKSFHFDALRKPRSPKMSLFLTFPNLLLKWQPNLRTPAALSLRKPVCPRVVAVTHVPCATVASSMPSAFAGR